jgi:hypothetical protein
MALQAAIGPAVTVRELAKSDGTQRINHSVLAFATLPRWARHMYGRPDGPLSDMAATAGLRATRLAFSQQRLFHGALRAIHRAETASESGRQEHRAS